MEKTGEFLTALSRNDVRRYFEPLNVGMELHVVSVGNRFEGDNKQIQVSWVA
jgi:hypothetical protein